MPPCPTAGFAGLALTLTLNLTQTLALTLTLTLIGFLVYARQ